MSDGGFDHYTRRAKPREPPVTQPERFISMTEQEALGYLAFGIGTPLLHNPNTGSSEEYKQWESGWKQNWWDQMKARRG